MSDPVFQVYYPQPAPTHQSHESYLPVIIVLAVIFTLAVTSYVIGRLCRGRNNHSQSCCCSNDKEVTRNHHSRSKEGDIEFGFSSVVAKDDCGEGPSVKFGFDQRFQSGKGVTNEEFFRWPKAYHNEGGIEFGFDERFRSGKETTNVRGHKGHRAAGCEGGIEFRCDDERFPCGKETTNVRGLKGHHNGEAGCEGGIKFRCDKETTREEFKGHHVDAATASCEGGTEFRSDKRFTCCEGTRH